MELGKIIDEHQAAKRTHEAAENAASAANAQQTATMLQEHARLIQAAIKDVILPVFTEAQQQLDAKGFDPRLREAKSTDKRLREITIEIELDLQGGKLHPPEMEKQSYILRYAGDVDRLIFRVESEIYKHGTLERSAAIPVVDVTAAAVEAHVTQFVRLVAERES